MQNFRIKIYGNLLKTTLANQDEKKEAVFNCKNSQDIH